MAPEGRAGTSPRAVILVTVAAALLVLVAAGLIWLVPRSSPATPVGGPSGVDQFGAVPGSGPSGRTNDPSAGNGSGTGTPTPGPAVIDTPSTSTSTATGTGGAGPSAGGAPGSTLAAAYTVASGVVDTTITVKITNPGTTTSDGWTVVMKLSGVPLTVRTSDGVNYQGSGRQLTFTPSGVDRAVTPGSELTFSYAVTGLLNGRVQGCTIDGHACAS